MPPRRSGMHKYSAYDNIHTFNIQIGAYWGDILIYSYNTFLQSCIGCSGYEQVFIRILSNDFSGLIDNYLNNL